MGKLNLINPSGLIDFYRRAVQPLSQDEDTARREFILKTLILGGLHLAGIAILVNSFNWIWFKFNQLEFHGASPWIMLIVFGVLIAFYKLTQKQYLKLASYLFLGTLWLSAAYTPVCWGALLNQAVLIYALVITFAGILINNQAAFISTLTTVVFLIILTSLQKGGFIEYNHSWRQSLPGLGNALTIGINLTILTLVTWLANREIKQALQRARDSEKALSKQLALFHDIRNPLTSAWLNVENAQQHQQAIKTKNQQELQTKLKATLSNLEQVGELLARSKTELPLTQEFSPKLVIDKTLELLQPQARQHQVELIFKNQIGSFKLEGDPFKFKQIVSNLVTNAIEASQGQKRRSVKIRLRLSQQALILQVIDFGCGINKHDQAYIFAPLYSTKSPENNFGLGLEIVKNGVEDHFGGQLKLESQPGKTIFTAIFPG